MPALPSPPFFRCGMFLFPQLPGQNIFTAKYRITARDLAFSAIALAIGMIPLGGTKMR